jgi:hypothetical protein
MAAITAAGPVIRRLVRRDSETKFGMTSLVVLQAMGGGSASRRLPRAGGDGDEIKPVPNDVRVINA